jgi:hypothetical protein
MTGLEVAAVLVVVLGWALIALVVWRLARFGRQAAAAYRRHAVDLRCTFGRPGPSRDVLRLRQRLADEVRSTANMVAAAPDRRVFQADASTVLAEITAAARPLDAALADIATFRDPGQQRVAVATVAPQVEQVIETCYTVRQTMLRTAVADRSGQLNLLRANVAQEADALAIYERAKRERPS